MAFSTTEYMNRYGRYPGSRAPRQRWPVPASQWPAQRGAAFRISPDVDGIDAAVDDMMADFEAAARPAAQAGAQILYSAVLRNVASLGTVTGNLENSIYQAYVEKESGAGRAVYDISWNPRKAPHGHLVEFGHIMKYKVYVGSDGRWYTNKKAPLDEPKQVAGKAFVRRAAASIPQAERAMEAKFYEVWNGLRG